MAKRKGAHSLSARHVYTITFVCRPIRFDDDEPESDTIDAYWTGEIDTWGKLTFIPIGGADPLYLFKDELVEVREVGQ
jgi:hypothetical protein